MILTHSRMSCFRSCPRKHFIRYELGIKSEQTQYPQRVGSLFHQALEAMEKGIDISTLVAEDPFDMAIAAAMFVGHCNRYQDDTLETLATELEFDLPLINPETGASSQNWRIGGKIDRLVKLPDGRTALMEYKTTSRDFSPGADYWLRLHMDQQLSIYVIAARQLGYDVSTILYDVTRRPSQRPLKATPLESRKYTKDGALYASQRRCDETPEEYTARISEDIASKPDSYFSRIEIPRLDQDLQDCATECWQQQKMIREAQKEGYWYRNPGSCFENNGSCEYLPICMMRDLDTNTPNGFVRSENINPELAGCATSEG